VSDPRASRGEASRGNTGRTPAGFPTGDRRAKRPPRPVLVEVATALLIISGFMSLFTSLDAIIAIATSEEPDLALLALFLFIGVGTIAVGIALRYGFGWLFGVNYVAIAAFLELTSGTPQGLLFGGIDLFVLAVLLAQRPWFAWNPEDDARPRAADD
jgi:hypothetical protein